MLFYVVEYKHGVQVQPMWTVNVGFGFIYAFTVASCWCKTTDKNSSKLVNK